jgi:hypothetical protein
MERNFLLSTMSGNFHYRKLSVTQTMGIADNVSQMIDFSLGLRRGAANIFELAN